MIPEFMIQHAIAELSPFHDQELIAHLSDGLKLSKEFKVNRRGAGIQTQDPTVCERFSYDAMHQESLPGILVLDESGPVGNPDNIAKLMHQNHGLVRQFWRECLGLQSFSNAKIDDLNGSCHVGNKYANAYYSNGNMAYGDGDGKIFLELTNDLDVGGHELGHGVVDHSKNPLKYWFDSGAINEHIADVLGECCSMFHKNQRIQDSDWLLGADIIAPYAKSQGWRAIRSFKKELAYPQDPQPKHNSKKYKGFQDNGGVHINSGILNHWFYLMCMYAPTDRAYKEPVNIVVDALNLLPHAMATFTDYVKATRKAAADYNTTSRTRSIVDACDRAWREVGLLK